MISGAVFHILGICDGGAPSEKTTGSKEKMQILRGLEERFCLDSEVAGLWHGTV